MNPLMYVDIFSCYTILLFQCFDDITAWFKFSTTSSVILMTRKDKEDTKKSLNTSCNHRGLEKFLNDSVILRILFLFIFFFIWAKGASRLREAEESSLPPVKLRHLADSAVRGGDSSESKNQLKTHTPRRGWRPGRPDTHTQTHTVQCDLGRETTQTQRCVRFYVTALAAMPSSFHRPSPLMPACLTMQQRLTSA